MKIPEIKGVKFFYLSEVEKKYGCSFVANEIGNKFTMNSTNYSTPIEISGFIEVRDVLIYLNTVGAHVDPQKFIEIMRQKELDLSDDDLALIKKVDRRLYNAVVESGI